MKALIEQLLIDALEVLRAKRVVPAECVAPVIRVTRTRDSGHGDFSTNLAMLLAEPAGLAPRELAQALIDALAPVDAITDVVPAGPGFINFFLADNTRNAVVAEVFEKAEHYGTSNVGAGRRVRIIFELATPTAPLHVAHGRRAVVSACLADLLSTVGFRVERELHVSGYQRESGAAALRGTLDHLAEDLAILGIHYDRWQSAHAPGVEVLRVIERIQEAGYGCNSDGVLRFRANGVAAGKGRVLLDTNGVATRFASTIAHIDSAIHHGVSQLVYLPDADQQTYADNIIAACEALGHAREKLQLLLVQDAVLKGGDGTAGTCRGSETMATIRELHDEAGRDAVRYFHVMRSCTHCLDFDVTLAGNLSRRNPVYHVQFAHALVSSLMRQLEQRDLPHDQLAGLSALTRLQHTAETDLLALLAVYPDFLARAALAREPHRLTVYLRDLANGLHSYYQTQKILVADHALRHARVCLMLAVRQVLANGLSIIGVSTPEVM